MVQASGASTDTEVERLRKEIDRLVGLGILHRGLVLDCGYCGAVAFRRIADVSDVNRCGRCGADNPLSLERWRHPTTEPTWWYDLHLAARELLAEDAGVAILCAGYLRRSARVFDDLSEFEFRADGDPEPFAEIDLIASVDDCVVIGEAKTRANLGGRQARAAKAAKLARVAQMVEADEVILCAAMEGKWSTIVKDTVFRALRATFGTDALTPRLRLITGLGTSEVSDQSA
jgi:hypothetical protein